MLVTGETESLWPPWGHHTAHAVRFLSQRREAGGRERNWSLILTDSRGQTVSGGKTGACVGTCDSSQEWGAGGACIHKEPGQLPLGFGCSHEVI